MAGRPTVRSADGVGVPTSVQNASKLAEFSTLHSWVARELLTLHTVNEVGPQQCVH